MDLTGITNQNEFYTPHYLNAVLGEDLRETFSGWSAREQADPAYTSPPALLNGLAKKYFAWRDQASREKDLAGFWGFQREFLYAFFQAAGYPFEPAQVSLDRGPSLPLLGQIVDEAGAPKLWLLEALPSAAEAHEDFDPLKARLHPLQYGLPGEAGEVPAEWAELDFETLISKQIFAQDEPPRWVLLCSFGQVLLIDRDKWNEKRLLRFDLSEILGRREMETLKASMALLHKDSVCPYGGTPLHDSLNEKSHKHAYGVTGDLKRALRKSIELLGNEAIWYLREVRKEKVFELDRDELKRVYKIETGSSLAEQLSLECLRYMYRLLFLFYIEARPELGYAPIQSETYRTGYSLESLRELELVQLSSEASRQGYYFDQTLGQLFALVYQGVGANYAGSLFQDAEVEHKQIFRMSPLQCHLFDPERTPLLNKVKLRNQVLQEIVRLMSLSRSGQGRQRRRGRISYAQLGISQLGQVYESLLSYRGFFAENDLYEVKPAGDYDELAQGFFVRADDLPLYKDEEKVKDENGALIKHEKGRFLYRLAGRDREKSASYYTPEVLTQCLVKYALKELLHGKSAEEILHLTVCEPAMGSAAFLNEAVNQLAEAYLQKKQAETGEHIPHDAYAQEKQKVKMFLADNNVFGVDLNPVAVELAEVSLWLNTIFQAEANQAAYVPWFGLQLVNGNSLIGARRELYTPAQVVMGKWYEKAPLPVPLQGGDYVDGIWHFLLGDAGMANYGDKVIKELAEDRLKLIKTWREGFLGKYSSEELEKLQSLSASVQALWQNHVKDQQRIRTRTTDPLAIWGQPAEAGLPSSTRDKDRIINQELYSREVRNSSAYRRLKLVMDYWCALWFWPIEQAHLLPESWEYLADLSWLIESSLFVVEGSGEQMPLFAEGQSEESKNNYLNQLGVVDVEKIVADRPRLQVVEALARQYKFMHWELEFADIFARQGGFDLVLGNPPWIKVEWNEGGLLGDHEPRYVIQKFTAPQMAQLRQETLDKYHLTPAYFSAFEEASATQNYLNGMQNYPLLKGIQTNLYKCFLPLAWRISRPAGVAGFVHPEGVYDDPKGGALREALYPRLRYHFQFQNGLMLFAEVAHREKYSINIYNNYNSTSFIHLSNLFNTQPIDASFSHHGMGVVDGIKDDENNWNLKGHRDRIIHVDPPMLDLFAQLYDEPGTPALQARLPVVHSQQVVEVLRKFAAQPRRLGDLQDEYYSTVMFDETYAQRDGITKRQTQFPAEPGQWILSGPHFYVGNPFYKTPRAICTEKGHYDTLDLSLLPDDYLPRSNYVPACPPEAYLGRTPKVPWDGRPVTDYYRVTSRTMVSSSAERTLISAIIPQNSAHIDLGFSIILKNQSDVPKLVAAFNSVPFDFFMKTTGKGHFRNDVASMLPVYFDNELSSIGSLYGLLLNCLTSHYSELWAECWDPAFAQMRWAKADPRLDNGFFARLSPTWQRDCALRSDYARRQALVEIDVLAAMALGLTLEELQTIYRIQFPVMRQYEQDTWYDQNGRIVFTSSKGLPGVGFDRKDWEAIKDMPSGSVERKVLDDTLPGGPVERTISYVAPFDKCDRESDYAVVWREFESR